MATVLFRCDASAAIGAGHVMRCLALAETLARFGWVPVFAVSSETLPSVPSLHKSGYSLVEVMSVLEIEKLSHIEVKAVVIDHYGLDAIYERQLRRPDCLTVVLDDLSDRLHDCDVLVDSAPGRRLKDYASLVPPPCRLLLGSRYALVRAAWREKRADTLARLSQGMAVKRIVVSMGATDPANTTSKVLDAIAQSNYAGYVDVVLGAAAPHISEVSRRLGECMALHIEPDNLTDIVSSADLAIGAPGSSSFERAVIGMPSILIPTAANQHHVASAFAQKGAAEVLPVSILDDPQALTRNIEDLLNDREGRIAMSSAAASVTDGRGSLRLLAAFAGSVETPHGRVNLRLVEASDEDWLLDLQRQPETRRFALNAAIPDPHQHAKWLARVLDDPDRLFAIVVAEAKSVGMVRLDRIGDCCLEASIAIDESLHGKGIGSAALKLLRRLAPGADLQARILPQNTASIAMFTRAGYELFEGDRYVSRAAS